jgi:hypothetical protein
MAAGGPQTCATLRAGLDRALLQQGIDSRARQHYAPALCGLRRRLRPSRGMVPPVALVRVGAPRPARYRLGDL